MSRLKVPLILFCVVFLLCGLLSFFSGASWLGIIFKSGVSAIVIIVFLALARFFLLKYIPDLFENKAEQDVLEPSTTGANLDIRIGEKEDFLSETKIEKSMPSKQEPLPKEVKKDSILEDSSVQLTPPNEAFDKSDTSLSAFKPMSFSEEKKDNNKENPLESSSTISDKQENDINKVDSNVNDDVKLSEEELVQGIEKDVDRLEELPDLQEFVDSSNVENEESKGDELMNTGTQSFFSSTVSENVTDTNLMASAIRTVLKQEN